MLFFWNCFRFVFFIWLLKVNVIEKTDLYFFTIFKFNVFSAMSIVTPVQMFLNCTFFRYATHLYMSFFLFVHLSAHLFIYLSVCCTPYLRNNTVKWGKIYALSENPDCFHRNQYMELSKMLLSKNNSDLLIPQIVLWKFFL